MLVYKEVEVEVDVDDFDRDELIEAVEQLGLVVVDPDDSESPEGLKDRIRKLSYEYLEWHHFGMSEERFQNVMKQFFLDTLNEHIL